jgi:hypothetical protein
MLPSEHSNVNGNPQIGLTDGDLDVSYCSYCILISEISDLSFVHVFHCVLLLVQGLGYNNNQPQSAINVTMTTSSSKCVSTLSSNFSNLCKTVERLVEVQEKQIAIQMQQTDVISRGPKRLIESLSHGPTMQSSGSIPFQSAP